MLLDLRMLLMERGHPGSCVKCFFHLFGVAGREGLPLLAPLRRWLEEELEIVVSEEDRELEALPVEVRNDDTLERFCHRAISRIRDDRAYSARKIALSFRYRAA